MTQTFSQGEPNLVNEPIDISSDTSLSLPEILPFSSTPSGTGQTSPTLFATNFSKILDDRFCELQGTSKPLQLDLRLD